MCIRDSFWEGRGEMTPEGYIQPDPALIKEMFFRKPGLPILMAVSYTHLDVYKRQWLPAPSAV